MKVKYEFVNEAVEIDVDEKWAEVLMELDREEYNNDKKESRRHLMLDPSQDATAWTIDEEDPEEAIIEMLDSRKDLEFIMSILNEKQKKLIEALFIEGLSQAEYAEKNGIKQASISQQLETIRKKLKKYF